MKKIFVLALALCMLCVAAMADEVLQVGFENSLSEPVGQGMVKWQELLAARNVGLTLELLPDSQLGNKTDLIDQMLLGEPVMTLADGAFFADYKTAFTEITRLRDRRLIVKRNYSTPILEQWDC